MNEFEQGYFCRSCGSYHDGLPMSYGSSMPAYCFSIPEEEHESRIEMNDDLCIIDEEYFFIRGAIELPVIDGDEPFIWNIWVSLSEENFDLTMKYWKKKGRDRKVKPMFGWLSTSLPCYPETLNLRATVHTRAVGLCPFIELEPTDHPLAIEQRKGITLDRIKEIAEEVRHPES